MATFSSSKVTVEYHDPSGVFPLISSDLASRLPLRNLNWKSPTRPLRSIDALHVEFVPDAATSSGNAPSAEKPSQPEPNLWSRSASQPVITESKERRHQIPGLRQTPYLKLYILRCDDKETYKADSRTLLREWVREQTPPTESTSALNNRKNHDAFEWMIIHVVIPDTSAASEPRWTTDSKDPDELAERKSSAKWAPIKKTRTVLDKIRADFNPSGKSATERVAQIRPRKTAVPLKFLPSVPAISSYNESAQEQENAWQDLVGKFKTLILSSFDLRVLQYEDDINEKDKQRSLPGWNFCTFFVLKEGLARGFEAVGLVEDALAIYDELSVGLDTAVRDDTSDSSTTFLGDMSELRSQLLEMTRDDMSSDEVGNIAEEVKHLFERPLDPRKKDYRSMIVSSTISLFDFQSYIFSRQRALLFRLGNLDGQDGQSGSVNKQDASTKAASEDDLLYEADVCKRAAAFVSSNARILRRELGVGSNTDSVSRYDTLVEHVASSWMYAAAEQVLDESATPSLPSLASLTAKPQYQRTVSSSMKKGQGANPYSVRHSSLLNLSPVTPQPEQADDNPDFEIGGASSSGLAELAASRAQLLLLQRRILELVGKERNWVAGWAAIASARPMTEVSLVDQSTDEDINHSKEAVETAASTAVLWARLASALVSLESFQIKFEEINDLAIRHFMLGRRTKSAENLLGDYALLKFQVRDYATAAQYFSRVAPMYLQSNWSYIQSEMLRIYARCLKELHRKDEYMRVTLSLLGKVVAKSRSQKLPTVRFPSRDTSESWLDEDYIDMHGDLAEIVRFSEELPYNFTAAMGDYFVDIKVDQVLGHHEDKDGFILRLQFQHLLEDDLPLDRIRVRLVNVHDSNQDIWLERSDVNTLKQGVIRTSVGCNISTSGRYLVDKVCLEAKKLHFVHEFQRKPQQTALGITVNDSADRRTTIPGPSILLWPRHGAFKAAISLAPDVHLEKLRSILVSLDVGSVDVQTLDLRLRPASAGLRIHTADTSLENGDATLDLATGGTVKMGAISQDRTMTLRIPYSLESTLTEVTIRLEAHYQTEAGYFVFLDTSVLTVELPLDVDVNDTFKQSALFSKFSVRTRSSSPLLVTSVDLADSAAYDVHSMPWSGLTPIFEKQPACLTYKITRKQPKQSQNIIKKDAALALTVQYHSMDSVVFDTIMASFVEALTSSPCLSWQGLLSPILARSIRSQLTTAMLEEAILVEEIPVPTFGSIPWSTALASVPAAHQTAITKFLESWHASHLSLAIPLHTLDVSSARRITIPVSVPCISVVHTASLHLLDINQTSSRIPPLATVGQAISAEIRIKHTRAWSESSILGSSTTTGSDTKKEERQLEFVYQLQESGDVWLVGGRKRARFSAREDEETVFGIVLIPLRAGRFVVPSVDVSIAEVVEADRRQSVIGPGAVTCETDYVSAGQAILVVNGNRKTSVAVVDGVYGPAGGASTLERASTDSRVSRLVA